MNVRYSLLLGLTLLGLAVQPAHAQWLTQSITLKPGWNAVYLHVDATHNTIDQLVGSDLDNPIGEIWLWQAAPSTLQFIEDPQLPSGTGTQWASWIRLTGPSSDLQRLIGNAAYLVYNEDEVNYDWEVQGRPLPPSNEWTSSGLNFVGFPTPAGSPPLFANFLAPAPALLSAEIYRYPGGELSASNPQRLFAFNSIPVVRGEAYWIRAGDTFNRYFGPFELIVPDPQGIRFRDTIGQVRLRLRNITTTVRTVNLSQLNSEPAPSGQTPVDTDPLPVLVRGALNTTNLTHAYSDLSSPVSYTLQPRGQLGSEVEIVLGVNRSAMTGNAGDLFAGVLRFQDTANLSQVDVGVSAEVASPAGLWVGEAQVTQVRSFLPSFQVGPNGALLQSTNTGDFGSYIVTSVNTNLGPVARSFPLRLILHADNGGSARLMQRVYQGLRQATNLVLTTEQRFLDAEELASARRITAVHLPWSRTNENWAFSGGALAQGNTLSTTVTVEYDDQASNPFIHAYHPDHDNLNAAFSAKLAQGNESYRIDRQITLQLLPPTDDFASLTTGSRSLGGNYAEVITLHGVPGESRTYEVAGAFLLRRISAIATLITE